MNKRTSEKKGNTELRKKALSYIKKEQLLNIGLFLVLFSLIFIAFSLIYLNTITIEENTPNLIKRAYELNNKFFNKEVMPAAIVNGERIEIFELEKRYSTLPDNYKQFITKQEVLQQMIDEKILLQEAMKKGINATNEEVLNEFKNFLFESGIREEEFYEALKQRNLSMKDANDFYYRQIIFTKLLNFSVLSKINISEKDIENYYNKNKDLFLIPESINVSHLLICHNESLRCASNFTKEEALNKINSIKNEINQTNFQEKVAEYSFEPGAMTRKGNLGWITKEDSIDPTFLNASFDLNIGEISEAIETPFGYHLIIVFDKKQEEILNLSAVKDQINNTLSIEKGQELYDEYLSGLRNASIINAFKIK